MDKSSLEAHNLLQRKYYDKAPKANMVPTGSPYLRRHVEQVVRVLTAAGVTPDQRILEVGCGMGRYTLILAELGYPVVGMDLSPVLLSWLRQYDGGRYNIPLFSADLLELPLRLEARFDVVLGTFMLHHLHDIPGCITSLARLLPSGGLALFLEPNPYNLLYYVQMALKPEMTWEGDKGILNMRPAVLRPAMQAAGLAKFQFRRFGFFPPIITNAPGGLVLERSFERFPLWKPWLPFQIFWGVKE